MPDFDIPNATQVVSAVLAFVFCGLIGLERQLRHKNAGVRTHVLVGLGSCLFTLVSLYGAPAAVGGVLGWDASRIAAQVVTGVGFLCAGLIFVQRDSVRGLTTAASIWVAAAVGMACGAAMYGVALMVLLLHFLIILMAPLLRSMRWMGDGEIVELIYEDGRGILREILLLASARNVQTRILSSNPSSHGEWRGVEMLVQLQGRAGIAELIKEVGELEGVSSIAVANDAE